MGCAGFELYSLQCIIDRVSKCFSSARFQDLFLHYTSQQPKASLSRPQARTTPALCMCSKFVL